MGRVQHRFMKRVKSSLSRIRHFRGHGIHSPYIYSITRDVFMRRSIINPNSAKVYDYLVGLGLQRRYAIELQNLYTYCGYSTFAVNSTAEFVIYDRTESSIECKDGTTVVILMPRATHERELMCEQIVAHHHSTSVMRAEYLIIFNNHLPKQHFSL